MDKFYDKAIQDSTDWGGDSSTGGLRVTGKRVQEYIKGRFARSEQRLNATSAVVRSGVYQTNTQADGGLWYDVTYEASLRAGDVVSCSGTSSNMLVFDKATMQRVGYATPGGDTYKAAKDMVVYFGGSAKGDMGTWKVTPSKKESVEGALDTLADAIASAALRSGTLIAELASAADDTGDAMNRIQQTLGHYSARPDIKLVATETGVAISKDGVKVEKEGWAIAEFTAVKGNEYLMKPGTMDGSVCLFAEKITKEETRNIDYTYTSNEDGTVATARAVYGGKEHSYTYTHTYNDEGNVTGTTITDDQTGEEVATLPYQFRTTVGTYQPMTVLNAEAELPKDGYCRLVSHFQSDASLTVVVSYNTADANLTMQVVRDGFTASVCTQLSNLSKRISTVAERLAQVDDYCTQALREIGSMARDVYSHDTKDLPLLCGQPSILFAHGTPQEAVVPVNWKQYDWTTDTGYDWNGQPSAMGQQYINIDATTGGRYIAVPNDNGSLSWKNF